MRQAIQLLVEDKPGVLMRVIGIITAKGFNVQSLVVRPDATRTGMTSIVVVAEIDLRLRQMLVNEMNRLVQVLLAVDISERFATLEDLEVGRALLPAE